MKENIDQPKMVSTCFEGLPGAEMMQQIMGEQGIGSLCEEMMRSMMNGCGESEEEPQEAESAPENHGKDPGQVRGSNKQEV